MSDLVKILKEVIDESTSTISHLNDYAFEIGIISDHTTRKKSKRKSKLKLKKSKDITNAELMFIHEHGSKLKHIPKRPVLGMTLNYAKTYLLPKEIPRLIDNCIDKHWDINTLEKELKKIAIKLQNYARWIIYQSDKLAPNKKSTIRAKKSDRPLLNTGQLARSITCRVVKIK